MVKKIRTVLKVWDVFCTDVVSHSDLLLTFNVYQTSLLLTRRHSNNFGSAYFRDGGCILISKLWSGISPILRFSSGNPVCFARWWWKQTKAPMWSSGTRIRRKILRLLKNTVLLDWSKQKLDPFQISYTSMCHCFFRRAYIYSFFGQ